MRFNGVDFDDGDFVIVFEPGVPLDEKAFVLIEMAYAMLVDRDACCKRVLFDRHGKAIGHSDIL